MLTHDRVKIDDQMNIPLYVPIQIQDSRQIEHRPTRGFTERNDAVAEMYMIIKTALGDHKCMISDSRLRFETGDVWTYAEFTFLIVKTTISLE